MSKSKDIATLNQEAWDTKDKAKAKELAEKAFALAEKSKDTNQMMLARITLAQVANFRMELEDANAHIEFIGKLITGSTPRKIRGRYHQQRCYYFYQKSQFQDLIEEGHRTLEIVSVAGLEQLRAWVLTTMGMAYQRLGDGNLALEYYRQAKALIKDFDDPAALSNIRMSMGTVLAELGRKAEGLAMFEESLNVRLAIGGDFHSAIILGNIAKLQSQMGDHAKALVRWTDAIHYFKKAGGMPLWAEAMAGRADTLRQLNRLSEAEAQLAEAIAVKDLPGPIRISLHLALARVHADAQQWSASIITLRETEALMDRKTTGHTQWVDLHSGLYQAYKAMGDTAMALHHHEEMAHHRQAHLNDQSVTKLAEWEVRYHMERLREKDEKLSRKTAELENILKSTSNDRKVLLSKLARYDVLIDEMLNKVAVAHRDRFNLLLRAARKEGNEQDSDEVIQNRISEKHPELSPSELRICSMIVSGWTTRKCRTGAALRSKPWKNTGPPSGGRPPCRAAYRSRFT
jgi:tetratricopeptide (TPR) repeat protein